MSGDEAESLPDKTHVDEGEYTCTCDQMYNAICTYTRTQCTIHCTCSGGSRNLKREFPRKEHVHIYKPHPHSEGYPHEMVQCVIKQPHPELHQAFSHRIEKPVIERRSDKKDQLLTSKGLNACQFQLKGGFKTTCWLQRINKCELAYSSQRGFSVETSETSLDPPLACKGCGHYHNNM